MSRKKKTIEVAALRRWVNVRLAHPAVPEEGKKALIVLLETYLHSTGNYAGFNYVDWMQGGADLWRRDGEPADKTPYLGPDYKREYF